MHQAATPKDRTARIVGTVGVFISVLTFYFVVWRPACVHVGLGPQVFISSKPRIGVLMTLTNDGAHEIIITSGELNLDSSQFTIPLTTTALQNESWEYDREGN